MTISIRNAPGYALTRPNQVTKVRNVVGYALTLPSANAVVTGGDTDYRKSRSELLYRLLLKTNPKLSDYQPSSLDYDTVTALSVSDVTGGGLSALPDTSVVVKSSTTGGMIGTITARYRRIDLSKLFKGRTLSLTVPWSSATNVSKDVFIAEFAKQFGVLFHTDDFAWTSLSFDSAQSFSAVSGSWCWKGSITVTPKKGKRSIADFVGDRKLAARVWPQAMIDFQDGSKPQGELLLYHIDYSAYRNEFLSWTVNYVYNGVGGGIEVIVARLNNLAPAQAGITFTTGQVSTEPGLNNIKLQRYALPNAAVPEANSAEYAWCLVLEPQEPAWFFGKIIVHFN